jgi:hypothetical protein
MPTHHQPDSLLSGRDDPIDVQLGVWVRLDDPAAADRQPAGISGSMGTDSYVSPTGPAGWRQTSSHGACSCLASIATGGDAGPCRKSCSRTGPPRPRPRAHGTASPLRQSSSVSFPPERKPSDLRVSRPAPALSGRQAKPTGPCRWAVVIWSAVMICQSARGTADVLCVRGGGVLAFRVQSEEAPSPRYPFELMFAGRLVFQSRAHGECLNSPGE